MPSHFGTIPKGHATTSIMRRWPYALTKHQFAEVTGLPVTTIQEWERHRILIATDRDDLGAHLFPLSEIIVALLVRECQRAWGVKLPVLRDIATQFRPTTREWFSSEDRPIPHALTATLSVQHGAFLESRADIKIDGPMLDAVVERLEVVSRTR